MLDLYDVIVIAKDGSKTLWSLAGTALLKDRAEQLKSKIQNDTNAVDVVPFGWTFA